MELFIRAQREEGLTHEEIRAALLKSLEGRNIKKALIIPPDFTRFHSNAGFITNIYYHALVEMGAEVDILPALGTHVPVTEDEAKLMFGDVPYEKFIPHNWRTDVMKIGEVPAEYLEEITEGLWKDSVSVEINRLVMDESYDIIISPGQVLPPRGHRHGQPLQEPVRGCGRQRYDQQESHGWPRLRHGAHDGQGSHPRAQGV